MSRQLQMLKDETRNTGSQLSKDSLVSKSQLNIRNRQGSDDTPSVMSEKNLS